MFLPFFKLSDPAKSDAAEKKTDEKEEAVSKFLVSKYLKKGCILMSMEWFSLSIAGGGKEEWSERSH